MKKYQYAIHERVMVFDGGYWIIPATITAIDGELYKAEYDGGGYDWLLHDEIRPLEYHKGDYVQTMTGVGKVIDVNSEYSMVIVSYGKLHSVETYYEFQVKPAPKPSLWERLIKKSVWLYT